jgi:hypothetical protein
MFYVSSLVFYIIRQIYMQKITLNNDGLLYQIWKIKFSTIKECYVQNRITER